MARGGWVLLGIANAAMVCSSLCLRAFSQQGSLERSLRHTPLVADAPVWPGRGIAWALGCGNSPSRLWV